MRLTYNYNNFYIQFTVNILIPSNWFFFFQELLNKDFQAENLSTQISEINQLDLNNSNSVQQEKPGPQIPPFPELRYLNLSNNKVVI